MNETTRVLVALNGSPVRGSSVDLLLGAMLEGAERAGGRGVHFRCQEMVVRPCEACERGSRSCRSSRFFGTPRIRT